MPTSAWATRCGSSTARSKAAPATPSGCSRARPSCSRGTACAKRLDAYLRAEGAGSRDPDLTLQLGWCCAAVDRLDEAAAWMRRAVGDDSERGAAHYGLAVVLFRQRKLDDAVQAFQRAVELQPDDLQYRIALGNCVLEQGDGAAAEAHFRQAIAMDETSSLAWSHLGVALDRQERGAESLVVYEPPRASSSPRTGIPMSSSTCRSDCATPAGSTRRWRCWRPISACVLRFTATARTA